MKLNVYLNFDGKTEEAFSLYKSVFGGEFVMLQRFSDLDEQALPGKEEMSEEDLKKIMHVSLPVGSNILMGTDALEGQGASLTFGNNINLSLHPDSREESDRLFTELSVGGTVELPMQDMFWGDYYGMFTDRFGVKWMINYHPTN